MHEKIVGTRSTEGEGADIRHHQGKIPGGQAQDGRILRRDDIQAGTGEEKAGSRVSQAGRGEGQEHKTRAHAIIHSPAATHIRRKSGITGVDSVVVAAKNQHIAGVQVEAAEQCEQYWRVGGKEQEADSQYVAVGQTETGD